ncbi:MAG TPA: nitroreductase [Gammaproteobacteria bacterium]|nr:nitroreductase [Gammaproteobacteria bacterium]|tara:strand:+ start:2309 stop:2893 length:585 start_codon:yes stop_codon:yes gene_type:complete
MSKSDGHKFEGVARVLRERRTIHYFSQTSPPSEIITQAVDLARWAPNHHRTEPWHFYLLDRATGRRISDLNADIVAQEKGCKVAEIKRKRWAEMPGWLVVSCEISDEDLRRREDYAACCCAVQNVALYLWEQGIGLKWTTGEVTRDRRFFDLVGMSYDKVYVVGLFWYGYPASVPPQHRRPLQEILTHVVSRTS